MKHKDVIKYFGNATKAAASLDVTTQTIHRWEREGGIPLNAQKAIAWDTKGQLMPDQKDVKK